MGRKIDGKIENTKYLIRCLKSQGSQSVNRTSSKFKTKPKKFIISLNIIVIINKFILI